MKHNLTNLLINIYFALTDACDMLLREIEYRINYIEFPALNLTYSHR